MIGDLILAIMLMWRRTFCIHRYRPHLSPACWISWNECSKCGRTRDYTVN